jgi:hypothetical protein
VPHDLAEALLGLKRRSRALYEENRALLDTINSVDMLLSRTIVLVAER